MSENEKQNAIGSFIVQVLGAGSGSIEVNQEAPLAPIPATAPPVPAQFVGRSDYLEKLKQALKATTAESPLLIIQGMPGVGKTSVAKKFASLVKPDFPGGIFWASLPDYDGEVRPILTTWARYFGQKLEAEFTSQTLADLVRGLVAGRIASGSPVLIIIDDVRPGWEGALNTLRSAIPAKAITLITTRYLQLATSLGGELFPLEQFSDVEALAAISVYAGENIILGDTQTATMILNELGQLPLAIELVGKYISTWKYKPHFSLRTIYNGLRERHHSKPLAASEGLSAAFSSTYESLPLMGQKVFRWLGVFATARLSLRHISAVTFTVDDDLEPIIDNLVGASLLRWTEASRVYSIHPMLHEYAREKLRESGDLNAASDSHLEFYFRLLKSNVLSAEIDYDQIQDIHPELGAASKWAFQVNSFEKVNEIATMLFHNANFLQIRGGAESSLEILTLAISAAEIINDSYSQVRFATHLGNAFLQLGQFQNAIDLAERNIGMAQQLDLNFETGVFLSHLGTAYANLGKYSQALDFFALSRKHAEIDGNNGQIGRALLGMGQALHNLVRYKEARECYELALRKVANSPRSKRTESTIFGSLAHIVRSTGGIAESIQYYEHSLRLDRKIGYRRAIASWLGGMGVSYIEQGEFARALPILEEALRITKEIGDRRYESNWTCRLGYAYITVSDFSTAREYLLKGVALASEIRNATMVNYGGGYLAHTLLCLGEPDAAREHILHAQEYDIPRNNQCVASVAGIAQALKGEQIQARLQFERALREGNETIAKTQNFFKAHFAKGIAYAGLCAISENSDSDYFWAEARQSLSNAIQICSGVGVLALFKQELSLIARITQKRDIKGLLD